MLKVYSKDRLESFNREFIRAPWDGYFRFKKVTSLLDVTDRKIVEAIEETHFTGNTTIYGKFSKTPIEIGEISEGCKTLLCINHAIKTNTINKYIFDITSCGSNAIEYLAKEIAKDVDIYVYSRHTRFGALECALSVNDKVFNNCFEASRYYLNYLEEFLWKY